MKLGQSNHQSGQSFIILAVGFVMLAGFSALAIDGGILYSDRRHAQNAADSGALAGALAIIEDKNPSTPRAWTVAFQRSADNDYNNDGARNWVEVNIPPIDGPYAGQAYYVQVRIRSKVDSVFAHFVFSGDLENTVTAIARARPAWIEPFLGGQAVVGLAQSGCSVVWSHGTNNANIDGGGIFVNSNHPDCAFKASGTTSQLNVTDGAINVVGGWEISGGAHVSPPPTGGATQIDTPTIDTPTCDHAAVRDSATHTVTDGNISNFKFTTGNWTLKPGIYCVTGGFDVSGGTVLQDDRTQCTSYDYDPNCGVLIYVQTGDVAFAGTATLQLHAMETTEWRGLLIYQDPSDTQQATINGTSDSVFVGTMFFPSAQVQLNGTGGESYHSQIIGNTVDMSGTNELDLSYVSGENFAVAHAAQVDLAH